MKRLPAEEGLETHNGPISEGLEEALTAAGVIMERRLRERGQVFAELDDHQVLELFTSAFMETAPDAFPHLARERVEKLIAAMGQSMAMQISANADGGASIN